MLDDREYMRGPSYERRWSLTTVLIAVNLAVFVLQFFTRYAFDGYFALSRQGLAHGYLWQPITFQFMHAGIWHLAGNLITIYFFGPPVEQALGRNRFLGIYLGSGMLGGLLQVVAWLVFPSHFGTAGVVGSTAGVVGASAGAFGLVASFASLDPERPIGLFILPVTIRAKYLVALEVVLALVGAIARYDNVAHVAHLGGILTGIALTRWGASLSLPERLFRRAQVLRRPRKLESVRAAGPANRWLRPSPPAAASELPPAEFISKEVDPILEYISAHGIQSLTPREKRILEAASARIERR